MMEKRLLAKSGVYLALLGIFFAVAVAPLLHPAIHSYEHGFHGDSSPNLHHHFASIVSSASEGAGRQCPVCSFLANFHAYKSPVCAIETRWMPRTGNNQNIRIGIPQTSFIDPLQCRAPPFPFS
jgi:hypothetical protein